MHTRSTPPTMCRNCSKHWSAPVRHPWWCQWIRWGGAAFRKPSPGFAIRSSDRAARRIAAAGSVGLSIMAITRHSGWTLFSRQGAMMKVSPTMRMPNWITVCAPPGGTIYLDADIRIAYYPRATPGALWRQYFRYGSGRSRTMRRHWASVRLRQLAVPGHAVLSLASIAAAAIAGRWEFLAWPLFYLMLLPGASLLLAARKRAWCGFWGGPAAFIMHTAWAGGFFAGLLLIRENTVAPAPSGHGA